MQCASCGTELLTVAAYCTSCGAAIPHSAAEPASAATYPSSLPDELPQDLDEQNPSDPPNPEEGDPYQQPSSSRIRQGGRNLPPALLSGLATESTMGMLQERLNITSRFQIRGPRFLRGARPAGLIFAFIGLIFCAVALVIVISTLNSLQGTVTGQGQIVSCQMQTDTSSDQSGSDMCQPTVRFTTASGQEVEFTSSTSSNTFHEGDQVPVQYHPNNPQDALISSFFGLWFLPLIFGGLGGIFLVIGLFIILRG